MGRPMPDGSPALLKTRQHLRRDDAEVLWKNLLRSGFQKVPAVWGADAEPILVPVLTKGFCPMSNNAYVSENGDASNLGRSEGTFLFFVPGWGTTQNRFGSEPS